MQPLSIAFVDDHPALRDGLVSIFGRMDSFAVVGSGSDASAAFALAKNLRPDVIVVDLQMPGDVFESIAKIRQLSDTIKILAFTASERVDHAINALETGANGYVLKGSTIDELMFAIHEVCKDRTYVTPSLSAQIIESIKNKSKPSTRRVVLTSREEQIVRLLVQGYTNKMIGSKLDISDKTVKHYMTVIIQKLQVKNRLEVVLAAQKLSLVTSGLRDGSRLLN